MEVVASLSQGPTASAQCGLFTYKSVPVIFEPPCMFEFHCPLQFDMKGHYVTLISITELKWYLSDISRNSRQQRTKICLINYKNISSVILRFAIPVVQ